jgi:hypothetical protein
LNFAWISIFAFFLKSFLKSNIHICLNVVSNFWFIKIKLRVKIEFQNFKSNVIGILYMTK